MAVRAFNLKTVRSILVMIAQMCLAAAIFSGYRPWRHVVSGLGLLGMVAMAAGGLIAAFAIRKLAGLGSGHARDPEPSKRRLLIRLLLPAVGIAIACRCLIAVMPAGKVIRGAFPGESWSLTVLAIELFWTAVLLPTCLKIPAGVSSRPACPTPRTIKPVYPSALVSVRTAPRKPKGAPTTKRRSVTRKTTHRPSPPKPREGRLTR